jgi:hypothetical protein
MASSLYAALETMDGKAMSRLKSLAEYQALGECNEGLYRRDTGKFPVELFTPDHNLSLSTVADRLQGYFDHDELKSLGDVGLLERRKVVGIQKEYIGRESHPLAELADNPDEETLAEFRSEIPIFQQGSTAMRSSIST